MGQLVVALSSYIFNSNAKRPYSLAVCILFSAYISFSLSLSCSHLLTRATLTNIHLKFFSLCCATVLHVGRTQFHFVRLFKTKTCFSLSLQCPSKQQQQSNSWNKITETNVCIMNWNWGIAVSSAISLPLGFNIFVRLLICLYVSFCTYERCASACTVYKFFGNSRCGSRTTVRHEHLLAM